jgi:hypothetical protein
LNPTRNKIFCLTAIAIGIKESNQAMQVRELLERFYA